jgi:hypothetical protein
LFGKKVGGGRVGEETGVVERRVVVVINDNCIAPGNLKMDIPESPMKEEGDTIQHIRIEGGVKEPTSYIKAKDIICCCTYQ